MKAMVQTIRSVPVSNETGVYAAAVTKRHIVHIYEY